MHLETFLKVYSSCERKMPLPFSQRNPSPLDGSSPHFLCGLRSFEKKSVGIKKSVDDILLFSKNSKLSSFCG